MVSVKFKLSSTIPVVSYGNVMPEIEVEAETYEEALEVAVERTKALWDRFAEGGKQLVEHHGGFVELETFTGEKVLYNDTTHEYRNLQGKTMLSGSRYAKKFEKPFDGQTIAKTAAKSWGVSPEDVLAIWDMTSRSSMEFGSALHTAMELWSKHAGTGDAIMKAKKLKENYALPKNDVLKKAVLDFDKLWWSEKVLTEVVVSDTSTGRVGRIDRLVIEDEMMKVCSLGDYKTGSDITDRLPPYEHQLSFYAAILANKGWTVSGITVYQFDGKKWTEHKLSIQEIIEEEA